VAADDRDDDDADDEHDDDDNDNNDAGPGYCWHWCATRRNAVSLIHSISALQAVQSAAAKVVWLMNMLRMYVSSFAVYNAIGSGLSCIWFRLEKACNSAEAWVVGDPPGTMPGSQYFWQTWMVAGIHFRVWQARSVEAGV